MTPTGTSFLWTFQLRCRFGSVEQPPLWHENLWLLLSHFQIAEILDIAQFFWIVSAVGGAHSSQMSGWKAQNAFVERKVDRFIWVKKKICVLAHLTWTTSLSFVIRSWMGGLIESLFWIDFSCTYYLKGTVCFMALWKSWCLTCPAKASTAPSTTILLITVSTNTGTQYEPYTKPSTASSTSLEDENPHCCCLEAICLSHQNDAWNFCKLHPPGSSLCSKRFRENVSRASDGKKRRRHFSHDRKTPPIKETPFTQTNLMAFYQFPWKMWKNFYLLVFLHPFFIDNETIHGEISSLFLPFSNRSGVRGVWRECDPKLGEGMESTRGEHCKKEQLDK